RGHRQTRNGSSASSIIQAGCNRLTELVECERAGQSHDAIDLLDVLARVADADDAQSRLDRAELVYERLPSLPEEDAGDQDVEAYSAGHSDRLAHYLVGHDTVAALAQNLIDQLLYGCVFLDDEDGRGNGGRQRREVARQ